MIRAGVALLACVLPLALAAPAAPPPRVTCSVLGPIRWSGDAGELLTGGAVRRNGESIEVREPGRAPWSLAVAEAGLEEPPALDREATAAAFARALRGAARGTRVKGRKLKGEVDADGLLRGTWQGDSVAFGLAEGGAVFGGKVPPGAPYARLLGLAPRENGPFRGVIPATPAQAWAAAVAAAERRLGDPAACSAGGRTGLRLGGWTLPVAEGQQVAWRTPTEAMVVGPEGGAWYLAVPAPAALAEALAAQLEPGQDLRWKDGEMLFVEATDPDRRLPGAPLAPRGAPPLPVLPLLERPALAPLGRDAMPPVAPAYAGGAAIERALAAVRAAAGLPVPGRVPAAALAARGLLLDHDGAARAGGWLTAEPPGEGETLAVAPPGADPLTTLERWIADPVARARLLHPRLVEVGVATAPDGRAVARGRILRTGVKAAPRAWPADHAQGVPAAGPALTVWIPAPAMVVQGVQVAVLGPGGRVVRTEVRGPGEGTGADARTESVVQVWFPEGVVPGATYQWRISWYERDGAGALGGSFRVEARPRDEAMLGSPLAQQVLAAANRGRAELQRGPLQATRGATAAAWWTAAGGRGEEAMRLAGAGVGWRCAPAAEWAAWVTRDGPLPAVADPLLFDPQRDRFGAVARADGSLCVLVAGPAVPAHGGGRGSTAAPSALSE